MVISRSNWERLVELWDISEVASTISKTLISLYMIKAGLHEPEVDVKVLIHGIKKCRNILMKVLTDLELYINNEAPETELTTLLIEAYGDVNVEKIRDHLGRAIQGLDKLIKTFSRKPPDTDILKDRDVIELENILRKLSDTLSRKVGRMASEIYTF